MYKYLFQNILYPLYETGLRRRNTLIYRDAMLENQWKSSDELKDLQWQELVKLLYHAYEHSPYYQDLFKTLQVHPADIRTYQDFQKLPVCSREDVVAHKERMIAQNYRTRVIHKSTGGSTGVPVQFALDRDSYEWRTAATQRGYQWAGCEAGQHTLYMWGVDIGSPGVLKRLKTDFYHKFFNRKMFNCFEFTEQEMSRCLNYINTRRPSGIVAFTTTIYNFAKYVDENGLKCNPVNAVITGAEKLYDHQREFIETTLQTTVFNTYGCREFMLIAAECEKHEGLHVSVDNLFVEVLDDGKPATPGDSGEIIITDLHNYGMPFIRYRNGDVVKQSDRLCSCGRGLPLIEDVDGRRMDEIVAVNGKVLSGGFFPHLMKEFPEVGKYQVIQKAQDQLILKIVKKSDLTSEQLDFCQEEIRKVTGVEMRIDFQFVDEIPLTTSGKYRVTISEIASMHDKHHQ